MLRSIRFMGAGFALALLTFITACDSTEPGSSSLSILLTDAPGDVKAAVVTISEIYLQGGGEGEEVLESEAGPEDDENGGRVTVSEETHTVDLLTLTTSTMPLVSGAEVPARRYSQLRFVITGGYLEVENADGSTSIFASSPDYEGLPPGAVVAGRLTMPSFDASGLKVQLPSEALDFDTEETVLLVDFDVAQSFGQATGSGDWVMHPVITGVEVDSEAEALAAAARP